MKRPAPDRSAGVRRRLDLEQHALQCQPRHRNQRAGRRTAQRPAAADLIRQNAEPVLLVIHHQHGQLRHVGQGGTGRRQCEAEVVQRLGDLRLEARRQHAIGGFPALPGDVDHPGRQPHHGNVGIAVRGRVVQPGRIDETKQAGRRKRGIAQHVGRRRRRESAQSPASTAVEVNAGRCHSALQERRAPGRTRREIQRSEGQLSAGRVPPSCHRPAACPSGAVPFPGRP